MCFVSLFMTSKLTFMIIVDVILWVDDYFLQKILMLSKNGMTTRASFVKLFEVQLQGLYLNYIYIIWNNTSNKNKFSEESN